MFVNKHPISRSCEGDTERQIRDNIEMLDPNDLSEEPSVTATRGRLDLLASALLPRICPRAGNISLSPCAIRNCRTFPSSPCLIKYGFAFSPFGPVIIVRATGDDLFPQSCVDTCRPWQVCTSS
jgi:hypothetical protein